MASQKKISVWIVDDSESVRKSIAALLETVNMSARDFASATEFLAEFSAGQVDCLIVDYHMPDTSGLELLQLLQAKNIVLPIIVITARNDAALENRVMRAGAATMLNKPIDGDALIAIIEGLMPRNV